MGKYKEEIQVLVFSCVEMSWLVMATNCPGRTPSETKGGQ